MNDNTRRKAAQAAVNTFCEIMENDGRACDKDCVCWQEACGGCEDSQMLYREVYRAIGAKN